MSFDLLRRQQARLQEVATSGTFDSVVAAVEAAAQARAFTDEGRRLRGATATAGGGGSRSAASESAVQQGSAITLNESVARKVAEARAACNARKNLQDNHRRFLHSRLTAEELQPVRVARDQLAVLMRRKNDTSETGARRRSKKAKKGG
jgi:hypothetical protein